MYSKRLTALTVYRGYGSRTVGSTLRLGVVCAVLMSREMMAECSNVLNSIRVVVVFVVRLPASSSRTSTVPEEENESFPPIPRLHYLAVQDCRAEECRA